MIKWSPPGGDLTNFVLLLCQELSASVPQFDSPLFRIFRYSFGLLLRLVQNYTKPLALSARLIIFWHSY